MKPGYLHLIVFLLMIAGFVAIAAIYQAMLPKDELPPKIHSEVRYG